MSRTRLDAINTCLRGVGIAPVATEDDPDLDVAMAGQVVDQVNLDIQSRGWWFNKESNWKITPDETTGFIAIPSSVLSIVSSGNSRNVGLTIRDNKAYDLLNHTYDLRDRAFSEPGSDTKFIEFTLIFEIPFEDVPPIAKQAIVMIARRQFAQDLEVDPNRYKFQMQDEIVAYNNMIREDSKNVKRNAFTDNASVSAFLSRVGGYNAQRYGYGVFPKRRS